MLIISDCYYFKVAVSTALKDEITSNDKSGERVVIDMRTVSSPEEVLKKMMKVSGWSEERYFVLVGHFTPWIQTSDNRDYFVDITLPCTRFIEQLIRLSRKKITLYQYTLRLMSIVREQDSLSAYSLTGKEKKIREMVYKNLSVARIADKLMLSNKTIYAHLNNMKKKYRTHSLNYLYVKIQNGELPGHHGHER